MKTNSKEVAVAVAGTRFAVVACWAEAVKAKALWSATDAEAVYVKAVLADVVKRARKVGAQRAVIFNRDQTNLAVYVNL